VAAAGVPVTCYRRWSIRVPRILFLHVKGVALKEGWAVSDLVRLLVVFGASWSWQKLRKPENLDRLGKIARLGGMADMFEEGISHKPRTRIYPGVRQPAQAGRTTDVVTLILPAGYARLIEVYAATNRMSKSDAGERLLKIGLIAYLTAENALLQAVQRVHRQPESQAAPNT
jgi:hypothetical protein